MADSLLTNQNIDNSTIITTELSDFIVNVPTTEDITKNKRISYNMNDSSSLKATDIGSITVSGYYSYNKFFYLEDNFYLFMSPASSSSIQFTLLELREDNILHSCNVVTTTISQTSGTFDDVFIIREKKEKAYILQNGFFCFYLTINNNTLTVTSRGFSESNTYRLYCTDLSHHIGITFSSGTLEVCLYEGSTLLDSTQIVIGTSYNFGHILMYDNNYYSIIMHNQSVKTSDTCQHLYIDLDNEKIVLAGTASTNIDRCSSFYYDKKYNQYYLEGHHYYSSKYDYSYGQRFRPNNSTKQVEYIGWDDHATSWTYIFYADDDYVITGDGATTYLYNYKTKPANSLKTVDHQYLSRYCSSSAECPKLGGIIIPSSINTKNFTFKLLKPKQASLIYYPKNAIALEDSKNNQVKIIILE